MFDRKSAGIITSICLFGIFSANSIVSAQIQPKKQPSKRQMPDISSNIESFFDTGMLSDGAPAFGTDLYGIVKTAGITGNGAKNMLQAHFKNDFSYKNEHSTQLGTATLQHLSKNLYSSSAVTSRHLSDGTYKTYYNMQSNGILYKFKQGSIGASYDHYTGDIDMDGFTAAGFFHPDSKTNLLFYSGKRPHNAPGAVYKNIYERFYTFGLEKNISTRFTAGAYYNISDLSDSNKYTNFSLKNMYALDKTRAYSDALLLNYSHGSYDKFSPLYDSPAKTDYYSLGLRRDWPIYSQKRIWEWTAALGTVRDNNEPFSFLPRTDIKFIQNITKNQQLSADLSYAWYQKRNSLAATENKRENNYSFAIDYLIVW